MDSWRSAITHADGKRIIVRGHDLVSLMQHGTYADVVALLLGGRDQIDLRPRPRNRRRSGLFSRRLRGGFVADLFRHSGFVDRPHEHLGRFVFGDLPS